MASSSIPAEGNPSSSFATSTCSTIALDPEFLAATGPSLAALESMRQSLPNPNPTTALEHRANNDVILGHILAAAGVEDVKEITETKYPITSFDGASITLTRFATEAQRTPLGPSEAPRRALFQIHGGGFISGSVEAFAPRTKRSVLDWDTQVFAVGYRLAPESPAPGPVEDAYAALTWLSSHAAELGVDPARIVVMGESAGGGVAAGLTLVARDRGLSPPLALAVLMYPMLDDLTIGRYDGEDWPVRPFLFWKEADNVIGWGAYLGKDRAGRADVEVSIYDAPGRAKAKDLVGLPRTYIDTGGLDLFRDENLAYVARLLEANVQTEFHLYPGVPHGFELAGPTAVAKAASENRKRAIQSV